MDDENNEENERPGLKRSDSSDKKSSSINGCIGEKDSGVCDDKSESGTYTLDKNDPVVEEARKRIDQVFGVPSDSERPLPTSLDQVESSLASIAALKSILSSSKTDVNMYSSSTTIKRSSNDHPHQSDSKPSLTSSKYLNYRTNASCPSSNPGSDGESNSYSKPQRKQKHSFEDNVTNNKDQCSMWSRRNSMERCSIRSRTNSFTKKSSKSPSSSPSPSSISKVTPPPTVPISPLKSYNSGSFTNLSNQRRDKLGRSLSAHRNASDFDLGDCDDTNSLKSEASNASTTPSSGSGKGKSSDNKASSMRFNRAFALRRAKLGMDTLGVPLNLTAERQAHHSSILESRSSPRSTPSPTFNRSDGGRFSLR